MEDYKTKVCFKCGRELPVSEFHKNKATKDGLQSHCKECTKVYEKQRKLNHELNIKDGLIPVYTNPELAKFQPRELMAELKARGFTWDYMLEPQRKVLFSKI